MFKGSLKYNVKPRLILIALGFIISACKKDRLTGDKSFLVGKWEWTYSIYEYDKCYEYGPLSTTINPVTEGTSFTMEFFEKGIVKFFQDEVLINEYRVVVDGWQSWQGSQPFSEEAINFVILLDNNPELIFSGLVAGDSILTFKRPLESIDPICEEYENYWGRIK